MIINYQLFKKEIEKLKLNCNSCFPLNDKVKKLEDEIKKLEDKLETINKLKPGTSKYNEYIYIIQEREFVKSGEQIYKIGKSKGIMNRMNDYPKGSLLKMIHPCENCDTSEKELLTLFNIMFVKRTDIGVEYFHGEIDKMTDSINTYFNKINNLS